ncbi:Oxidoreductase NAD-binding domain-containing protein 1, partial [Nibea albiflora]
ERPVFVVLRRPKLQPIVSGRRSAVLPAAGPQLRHTALYPAQVCGIINESETVKRLRLAVDPDFSFKAGQWVDFFIPGVETVGGFSMCSSPGLLQREGVVELAVKYTKHPPAHWVHTACTVGSEVAMRVGGDFFFEPVSVRPLRGSAAGGRRRRDQPLVCREFPDKFSCDFYVTQPSTDVDLNLQPFLSRGRITEEELRAHVDPRRTLCFLCGPPPMIEAISKTLMDFGLPKDRILFEKWW